MAKQTINIPLSNSSLTYVAVDKFSYEGIRKVLGGNGTGTLGGLAPYVSFTVNFFVEDIATLVDPGATKGEWFLALGNTFIKPVKMVDKASDIAGNAKKAKPNQVHHYATNKSKTYTHQLENVTKKYGLDLDDAWNKELLPHQGRHPNAYHDYVLDRINEYDAIARGNKDIFLELFEGLKEEIRENPDILYKEYWLNKK